MIRSDSDSELTRESRVVDAVRGMSISALVMPAMVFLTNSRLSSMESSFSRTICGMCWPRMPASAMYWSVNSARARGPGRTPRDEVLEVEHLDAWSLRIWAKVSCSCCATSRNGTSSNRSRSSSSGGRLRSSSPGRCRQTFLSLPISEGTCRPFVMASYLSFGPYWPNVSAPLHMGRCLLTALVISKFHS